MNKEIEKFAYTFAKTTLRRENQKNKDELQMPYPPNKKDFYNKNGVFDEPTYNKAIQEYNNLKEQYYKKIDEINNIEKLCIELDKELIEINQSLNNLFVNTTSV